MKRLKPTHEEAGRISSYRTRIVSLLSPKRLVLLLLLMAAILVTPAWQAWQSYVLGKTAETQLHEMIGLEGSIMHRDEVLTMSAMMAAATGNPRWISRYKEFGERLDFTIKEILNICKNDAVNSEAVLTTLANDKLARMENEALELVSLGNHETAAAILQSPEYEEHKLTYQRGMIEVVTNVRRLLESRRDKHWKQVMETITVISIILLVVIFAWFVVHLIRRRLARRIQAEQKLSAFAQEWRETFNAVTDSVCIIDKNEGKILQCNKAMTWFLKRPYNAIIGRSCCELIHGSAEPIKKCPLLRMWKTRRSETTVFQTDEKWLHIKVDPIINKNGDLVGAVHVISDITERKKAEKALRESEEKFRQAFANAQDAILWADIETGILVNCNKAAEELLGKTRGEIIGQHHTTLHPKERLQHYRTLFRDLSKGLKNNIDAEILTKSGEIRTVTIAVSTMFVEEKEIIQAVLRDITERKRALREIENLAKFPSEDPNPVLRISKDCRILYANDASSPVLKTWGVQEGQRLPEHWRKRIEEVSDSGNSSTFELTCHDGRIFFITLQPVVKPGYVNAYGLDITKRKKAEKERTELELQLSQKQKMEAIGTLAGGIAHDFNNILAAMQGYIELSLEDLPEGAAVRDNLEQVLSCGNRAAKLVKQVLTFSRTNQQEKELTRISSIVKEVLDMLRASLPATIKIRRKIEADSSIVLADPTQIHQVMVNLCTNASHAMRETGGLLEVNLTDINLESETEISDERLGPGHYVKLSVSDTGCGMDKEVMERIFEPFFTTKERNEGTGLGLSVVHGIIKSHDGAITVNSTPGEGTTFDIYLPKIESDEVQEPEPSELTARQKEVVLLVDDEEMMVDVTKQMLERLGYIVVAKTSSVDALETFQEEPDEFDLVITDQVMPNLTGTQLATELIAIRPDIPVILCTGFGEDVSPEVAENIGIKKFLMKPVSKHEIAAIIRQVLDRKGITT